MASLDEVQVLTSRKDLPLLVEGDLVNVDFPRLKGIAKVRMGNNGVLFFDSVTDRNNFDYWTEVHLDVQNGVIRAGY